MSEGIPETHVAPGGRAATQFKPGNPGRPQGARNKRTRLVEALVEGELETITRQLVAKALDGNLVALRLCLQHAAPAGKEEPVAFALPPLDSRTDVHEASKALMAAVAEGEITPGAAGRVMDLLRNHLAIIEARECEEPEPEPAPPPRPRPIVIWKD
ncbi:hypothetical protein E2493_20135 [Sphingomonas parva]|uniref:DUF5681 domain-containing protein n=1 Tax=Sphingomonas parva TaxID=2555898 RepID=A0A4Y8ZKH6_9SPHN|nr:DUF5681 domain-containing protein [Sphingomonas parva]TFI56444.1 hypothetical protein E2493_20135 [Sphingomonas parva]